MYKLTVLSIISSANESRRKLAHHNHNTYWVSHTKNGVRAKEGHPGFGTLAINTVLMTQAGIIAQRGNLGAVPVEQQQEVQ
jgi:hypothetical protein